MRVVNVAPRLIATEKKPRQYMDEWLTYLVNANGGVVDMVIPAAFAHIQDMQASGVEMTEALADYVLDSVAEARSLPPKSFVSKVTNQRVLSKLKPKTSVYFIRWGDRIKIGISVDPKRRLRGLSLPATALMFAVPGDIGLERSLHEELSDFRIGRSEWFHAVHQVLSVAERVRQSHGT